MGCTLGLCRRLSMRVHHCGELQCPAVQRGECGLIGLVLSVRQAALQRSALHERAHTSLTCGACNALGIGFPARHACTVCVRECVLDGWGEFAAVPVLQVAAVPGGCSSGPIQGGALPRGGVSQRPEQQRVCDPESAVYLEPVRTARGRLWTLPQGKHRGL